MKEYLAKDIRNVAIVGHMGCGKTSLSESFLYLSKAIAKKGEVERKNTVSDYLTEEQNRQTSLSTSLIPVEWKGTKINFLDTPGSEEFVGDLEQVLSVVEGAIVMIDATKGIEVGTERVWDALRERNIPTIVFINKMYKENVKVRKIVDQVAEGLGSKAVPLCVPVGSDNNYHGFVDVVNKINHIHGISELPAEVQEVIDRVTYTLQEKVAETDEELMEKFFMEEPLTEDEFKGGLKAAVKAFDLFPIFVGNATNDHGVELLLDAVRRYIPSPEEAQPRKGTNPKGGAEVVRSCKDEEPFSAYIFKTTVDPFLGTINMFKVQSGTTANLIEAYVPNTDQVAKLGSIITLSGKNQITVPVFHAGDIAAVTKTGELATTYTICDKKEPVLYEPTPVATPVIYTAIAAKTKNDEDKLSSALQKLNLEDPSFEIRRNPETAQLLIGGQGTTHIGYILEKMKNMFKVDVTTAEPKIVYRETIRRTGSAQGRHKKQSGGAGQFGDVHIRFEPKMDGGFEFASEVVGGSVPKNYFPAVEKGLIETLEHGPLAGFPVIGVRAVLYDGSYHPVDSNEISFKIAAALSFKEACKTIKPTILEPVMEVVVTVKDEYVGDIMGDTTKRRGAVIGMQPVGNGKTAITCNIPEAEIVSYATDLKAMTQGSGRFTRSFLRYDDVPEHLVAKIIEEYKPKQ